MSLASWLTQTAYVASVTSTDAYGKPVYGAAVARKVRVEQARSMVLKSTGEEAVAHHRLWCLDALALTDRVWLPGASAANAELSQLPLAVSSVSDKTGSRTLYKVEL